jgi:hypothetical protein
MTTLGFDDEILMILPFLMVPLQLYMMVKILKNTPYIVRDSVSNSSVIKFPIAQTICGEILCVHGLSDVD